jgi:hypothetical protein
MTDHRAMLQDIIQDYKDNCGKWCRREVGNTQHALDDTEHLAKLEGLMSVLCENWDIFTEYAPIEVPKSDKREVDNPGR